MAVANDGMLRTGSKGPEVAELQRRLNHAGETLGVDGEFGPATNDAVRRFQGTRGLEVDGVVGPATWGALADAQPAVAVSAPSGNNPAWPGRFLVLGLIGDDVRTWQRRMTQRGVALSVDGEYGPLSRDACIQLQTAQRLEVDGVVGPQTWTATWSAP